MKLQYGNTTKVSVDQNLFQCILVSLNNECGVKLHLRTWFHVHDIKQVTKSKCLDI